MALTPEEEVKLLLSSGNLHTEQQITYVTNNKDTYRRGVHHVLASETPEEWAESQPEGTEYRVRTRFILTGRWSDWSDVNVAEGPQAP